MDFETIKTQLEERGYKMNLAPAQETEYATFFKRVKTPNPCLTNDRDFIFVTVYDFTAFSGAEAKSAPFRLEIDMTGEFAQGMWTKMKLYSFTVEEFFKKADQLEASIVNAWNALAHRSETP